MASGREHSTTVLGKVGLEEAEKVRVLTGLSIAGATRLMQSGDVRHVMRSHGDAMIEAARGRLPIRKSDFLRIPLIVERASIVRAIGKPGSRKQQRLEYTAHVDGHEYNYVEELRGPRVLALKSMLRRPWGGARGE